MRNIQQIADEIVELSELKSAYSHYLASHNALLEVENATQIIKNKTIITAAIHLLKAELANEKPAPSSAQKQIQLLKIKHDEVEQNAILHFNRDKRFTITE